MNGDGHGPGGVPGLVLISGPEAILAEREVASLVERLREADPDLEVIRLAATGYEPGSLAVHAGPSLFGGWRLVVVEDLDEADDVLLQDVQDLLDDQVEGITLVVRHKSGNRGKRVLDVLKGAGARVVDCKAIKSEADKVAFARHEFRSARRRIDEEAVTALVQAVGKDVRELAVACEQLVRDTQGVIGVEQVEVYYGGRVETTGFKVADAAVAGRADEALRLLRHAFAGGLDPVPVLAVLAMKLRQVGRVASAGRASSTVLARDLRLAPWQVDQARRESAGWDGHRLGRAIQAVAAADVEVKGGLRTGTAVPKDPEYAVERAVLTVCRLRNDTHPA